MMFSTIHCECVCVCHLSGPSGAVQALFESLQISSVKPGTGREAQGGDTHMSLYQHPGDHRHKHMTTCTKGLQSIRHISMQ